MARYGQVWWSAVCSGVAWRGGRVPVGYVTVRPGKVRSGKAVLVRLGTVSFGSAWRVSAVKFSSGELGRGLVRYGQLRRSRYGLICRGFGVARRLSQGEVRYHMEGCGEIWRSGFGAFRFGSVRFGWAGHGGLG